MVYVFLGSVSWISWLVIDALQLFRQSNNGHIKKIGFKLQTEINCILSCRSGHGQYRTHLGCKRHWRSCQIAPRSALSLRRRRPLAMSSSDPLVRALPSFRWSQSGNGACMAQQFGSHWLARFKIPDTGAPASTVNCAENPGRQKFPKWRLTPPPRQNFRHFARGG